MSLNCPICSSQNTELQFSFFDKDKEIKALICKLCDLEFLNIWDDIDFVKSLYSGDNYIFTHNISSDKKANLKFDEYQNNYKRIKPYLNKDTSFLEIGCGDGKFLKMIKNDVKEIECIELSPPQVKKLRDDGFKCYDVMIEDLAITKKYDVICLFAVLEHVANVENFLISLKSFLNPNGKIFIEVPNKSNVLFSGFNIEEFKKFYYRSIHLYYFSPLSLKKLLNKVGLDCEIETSQQASITNHFHWIFNKKGQANANAMTSIVIPGEKQEDKVIAVLNKVDDFYRKTLTDNDMGDLLFAKVSL